MKKYVLLFSFISYLNLFSQYLITGTVESVPNKTPAFARVTLTNTLDEK